MLHNVISYKVFPLKSRQS